MAKISHGDYAGHVLAAPPTGKHMTSNESPNFSIHDKLSSVEFTLGLMSKMNREVFADNFSCTAWHEAVGGTALTCGPHTTSGL